MRSDSWKKLNEEFETGEFVLPISEKSKKRLAFLDQELAFLKNWESSRMRLIDYLFLKVCCWMKAERIG